MSVGLSGKNTDAPELAEADKQATHGEGGREF